MSFFSAMDINSTALSMNRLRMDLISQNIANAETTKTADGKPYRRKTLIVQEKGTNSKFDTILNKEKNKLNVGAGVEVKQIVEDKDFRSVYDPDNPEADENGYVLKPNVNIVTEMVNMISASRSYEASVTAMDSNKAMAQKALEIGKAG